MFLETERLILRRFTMSDVDLVVELDADADVMHFITGGRRTPREEIATDILPHWLRYHERFEGYGFWAALAKDSNEFIGWFHLRPRPTDPPDSPELGYRLRKSAWNKGYATEGSRALIRKAFADLHAARVYATTMTVNTPSRRVMEKSGLKFVRTFFADWPNKIEGDEHGDVEYAITRAEWLQRPSP
jgi:RimJ/RimL family protein N-acetyltransferase